MTTSNPFREPGGRYTAAPQGCDVECSVTGAAAIPVTVTFPGNHLAIVYVVGAESEEQAVTIVEREAFPTCRPASVEPGDCTGGQAQPFRVWVCSEQDRQQAQERVRQKRHTPLLRNERGQGRPAAGEEAQQPYSSRKEAQP